MRTYAILVLATVACTHPDTPPPRAESVTKTERPELPACEEVDRQPQPQGRIRIVSGPYVDRDEFYSLVYHHYETAVTREFCQRLSCWAVIAGGADHVTARGEATQDPRVCLVTLHHVLRRTQSL